VQSNFQCFTPDDGVTSFEVMITLINVIYYIRGDKVKHHPQEQIYYDNCSFLYFLGYFLFVRKRKIVNFLYDNCLGRRFGVPVYMYFLFLGGGEGEEGSFCSV